MKAEPSPATGSFFQYHLKESSSSEAAFSFASSRGPSMSAGLNQRGIEQIREVQDHSVISRSLIKSEILVPKVPGPPSHGRMHGSVAGTILITESEEITRRDQQSNYLQAPHSDSRGTMSLVTGSSSDDRYNWRKYGQKLVKGSEFPRSYYKCTYPNCEVKKIFERVPEGRITEIVYKGSHDHPKPQPSLRFTPHTLMSIHEVHIGDPSFTGQEEKFSPNVQTINDDPDKINGLSPRQGVDRSQDYAKVINEEDQFSRRRKRDGSIDITPLIKPMREPRVVVQTLSEVDILDDGYRWRKYGQKVVRGNPNPRSYYKCTDSGCPVRKHVERASHDFKAVITMYEGKHNHDVPTARSSSHGLAVPKPGTGISRITLEENEVSLNLGVGIHYGADSRGNGQLSLLASRIDQCQNSLAGSGMMDVQAPLVSRCYVTRNGGMSVYRSRDNLVDNRSLEMLPSHPGNQYPQNTGQLLMGP